MGDAKDRLPARKLRTDEGKVLALKYLRVSKDVWMFGTVKVADDCGIV